MSHLDSTDLQLLALLQENSNKTNKEYAYILGLSTTAVYERIKRLERTGVIEKYVALINKEKTNMDFMVFCHVKLIQHTKESVQQFERDVLKLEGVIECFHVSGDYDYILKIYMRDLKAYREFLVNKLTALRHVGSTQSTFIIGEIKNTTAVIIK